MQNVSKQEIAAVVARAANQSAEGVAPEQILRDLAQWLAVDEAIGLLKLLKTPRLRCARCKGCVSLNRASGEHCLGCARALRDARESEQLRGQS